ncbi:MAG: glycosyltransferase family 4 protein [Cyanobacteriota bacterium]
MPRLPRYAVLQPGARLHYAVPALLARAGALAALYTDLHGHHRSLRALTALWPPGRQPPALQRLLARRLPADLPRRLVREQVVATLAGRGAQALLQRAAREGFAGAGAVYTSFINDDLATVERARDQGLAVVHELIISADAGRILLEERRRFPGVEPPAETAEVIEAGIDRDRRKWALSDRVLVPSTYCLDSCRALGCEPSRLRLVPYGIPEHWFDLPVCPEPGRVLSVGRVSLGKGHHYLAEACRLLSQRRVAHHCRIAGAWQVDVTAPLFSGPTYLGPVPRSRMAAEVRRADVVVLPTLTDSFALAHLEAMACGVPVVTTHHCGALVRDGIEGFVVPVRDAAALAERLQQLIEDRALRQRLGAAARRRALDHGWSRYGERLLSALELPP